MDPDKISAFFGVSEGMRVADFGCGAGYFTILLGKLAGESGLVTAVDVLESALETVKSKAREAGLKNIETVRGNLEVTGGSGLGLESQDMVLLANVLFQSDNKVAIVEEAKRVLKPGGLLIVIDWKRGGKGFGPPDHQRNDPQAMRQMVQDAGFRLTEEIDAGVFHFGFSFRKI